MASNYHRTGERASGRSATGFEQYAIHFRVHIGIVNDGHENSSGVIVAIG